MSNKFECALGCHEYTIPAERQSHVLICRHCKLKGRYKSRYGEYKAWYDFDGKGNLLHFKDTHGYEEWSNFDDNGKEIRWKSNKGYGGWLSNEGKWVNEKPENWKYENEILK